MTSTDNTLHTPTIERGSFLEYVTDPFWSYWEVVCTCGWTDYDPHVSRERAQAAWEAHELAEREATA